MQVVSRKNSTTQTYLHLKGIKNLELLNYLESKHIGKAASECTVLSTDDKLSVANLPDPSEFQESYSSIINLKKVNEIQKLTEFFCAINNRLEIGGRFVSCVETAEFRKERLYKKFPKGINSSYYFLDYLGKRVAPKLPGINKVFFFLTANRNRVLTSVEVLGRLAYCGFRIVETKKVDNLLYIDVEKIKYETNLPERNYGFFFKMNRTGYQGKNIQVYKVRTMNAYSEFLQDYIYDTNNLDKGGKFKDDYRVNFMGNIMRKLWLDEVPMIYNWFKGDLKLVGVRPLSNHYLSLYSDELKEKRFNFKPGLVPPYYADMPETIEEIMESELRYFEAYEKSPLKTDVSYFFRALKNIVIKKARSK